MSEFLLYHTFLDAAEAEVIAAVLTDGQLDFRLEDESGLLHDLAHPMDKVNPQIQLRLRGVDFARADELIKAYYRSQLPHVAPDYMLYAFGNDELQDVLRKPQEWGWLNTVLAEDILQRRGVPVSEARVSGAQQKRLEQLRQPERLGGVWLFAGYAAALLGGFLGFAIGLYLLRGSKTLPNGERVYVFGHHDRRQGLIILFLSVVVILLTAIAIISRDLMAGA